MSGRVLWLGWVGLLVFVVMAVGLFLRGQGIQRQLAGLQNQRKALETDHQKAQDRLKNELTRYVKVLKRFPWLLKSGSGTAFLARLNDVTEGRLLQIVGVGPLDRKQIGQVDRIGRKVKVTGSFVDILSVVEKVERNRGILEGLTVGVMDHRGENASVEKLQAEFSLVTVELSPAIRKRMSSLLTSVLDPQISNGSPTDSIPQISWDFDLAAMRDPFLPIRPVKAKAEDEKADGASSQFPEVRLSGIINIANKKMAIINNRMLGEGDRFDGILVERVTEFDVVLKSESGGKRIRLPAFMSGNGETQN